MEVKNNPTVDQMLVNAATQTPAAQGAKAPKDADHPDFDDMVSQRRSAKTETADRQTEKQPKERTQGEKTDAEEKTTQDAAAAGDEQYAIAAAMMFQAQPDLRVTAFAQEETAPAAVVELVPQEQPQTAEFAPQTDAAPETEQAVAVETPVETVRSAEPTQQWTEAPVREAVENMAESETPKAEPTHRHEAAGAQRAEERPAEPAREQRPVTDAVARTEENADDAAPKETRSVSRDTDAPKTEEDVPETDAAQAAPVFARADTVPVKVAEAPRPVPLEADDGMERLTAELDKFVVNSAEADRIEVTLTPDYLGKLTVEVTRNADGTLSVVLHPTTERAANLLERGVNDLQSLLSANARASVQTEVRPAESTQQYLDPNGDNARQQGQQQQQQGRRREQRSAQEFLQQLRLGLVDAVDGDE